ncbi:MAG TPA: hypothetical protein VGQ71_12840 [Terriglobales bacterium]|nr:hypothetical protein [Terriglobales bacterium]
MAPISSTRGWGLWATAAAQVAGSMARRSRYWRVAVAGAQALAGSLGRVLHLLWLEITGLMFLVFAVVGGLAAHRAYQEYATGKVGSGRLVAALCFSVVFAWFGVSSFWRARRK